MKKRSIIIAIFWACSFLGYSQNVIHFNNYKHKVYTISPNIDEYFSAQFFIMRKAFLFSKKFYSIHKLPNIYILNIFSGKISPSISYDMLEGCILSREGKEASVPWGKCGLRIVCYASIDSTFRLLDYGLTNIKHIQSIKDNILSRPLNEWPQNTYIPNNEIGKALTLKLSRKKEVFIKRVVAEYNKKFKK